jgi:hypothetical protein
LENHFIIPNYPNQELLQFSIDLLHRAQNTPDQLELILQDSNSMLPLVRYLRDVAAYSIQQNWIWDSLAHSPYQWINQNSNDFVNADNVLTIQNILKDYQAIRSDEELYRLFLNYACQSENQNDPITALFLCILNRDETINDIITMRNLDPGSQFSIRYLLANAGFQELEEQFQALDTFTSTSQRTAHGACKNALERLRGIFQKLKKLIDSRDFHALFIELMDKLAHNPNSPGIIASINEQAESWRATLLGDFNDVSPNAPIHSLINSYIQTMGRDAMQQTIAALSTQFDFPIEINFIEEKDRPKIDSTIDGKKSLGSVIRNGAHYFVGYSK